MSSSRTNRGAKNRVQYRFPKSQCWRARDTGNYLVTVWPMFKRVGKGKSAAAAWANAERNLRGR